MRRVDPVLARLQPSSSSLIYGSNELALRQLVFNSGKKHYCLIFWLLRVRQPVSDTGSLIKRVDTSWKNEPARKVSQLASYNQVLQ